MPYVETTRMPAPSARARSNGSKAAPPTSTVSNAASAATAAGISSSRWSWVGTRLR